MAVRYIFADACFDGDRLLDGGPWRVAVENGTITAIEPAAPGTKADMAGAFLMPGLTEAHAHLFLDGSLIDSGARNAQAQASAFGMLATGRRNLDKSARAGITLVRDAGDRYGINHALRTELCNGKSLPLTLRSSGAALKRAKRYGAFIGHDVGEGEALPAAVAERCNSLDGASEGASDDIKIILTGVVDFTAHIVKGEPQFDRDELSLIVRSAHAHGRKTFAHCSGLAGLTVAVAAGVDSIEHGYFMNREILEQMADKRIAWVPTFAPVAFQRAAPQHAGWDRTTVANIARLLDDHATHVALAHALGVAVLAGSDAGSPGVDHGTGLIDELLHLYQAGLPMQAVLRAATSLPRRLWDDDGSRIAKGQPADMILLDQSPFDDPQALRAVGLVAREECWMPIKSADPSNKPKSWASIHDDDPIALPCIPPCTPER